ncbi:DUF4293 domain-containing protein [uncultured Acetobacteroides sp.]|uniref:DUF4293 domain-containing protein n=1 Tax=uncultured Acetobacteroides sp. TaxID=1760811 RepID=UPI0029F59471|nr:DUF4293 domain-containing protein [uncultured Acetobacteroides sp.]
MIQRIQTLFLLVAEVLTAVLFFSKLASFITTDGQQLVLNYNGIYQLKNGVLEKMAAAWPLAVILVVAAIVGLLVIFLYRRRMLQIRFCFVAMFLNFGILVLLGYYVYSVAAVGDSTLTLSTVDSFPILSMILYYLAYRGIAKDEAMVAASSFRSRR